MDENKIIEYYSSHTTGDTMNACNIGYARLNKILDKNDIEKHSHKLSASFMKATKAAKYGNCNYNNMEKKLWD